jgi:hypothetical protein
MRARIVLLSTQGLTGPQIAERQVVRECAHGRGVPTVPITRDADGMMSS